MTLTEETRMCAETEEQRVMIPGVESWMQWRAVCHSHPSQPGDFVAPWMAKELHDDWIDARLDALEHDLAEHPSKPAPKPSFDDLVRGGGEESVEELSLLPHRRHAGHVA